MTGTITDIHRTSVVDGPGIRTTVFLKGCPLSCIWCHNPETQTCHRQLGFNATKCVGCGNCVDVCPQNALTPTGDKVSLNRDTCNDCLACVDVCPTEALFSYGRSVTVDEVMTEVLKDQLYYDDSGGGVTISGGEPMMQPEFTLELLSRCKAAGIHTCLDTTGVGIDRDFRKTLDVVDLYLFDYKATDPDQHRLFTGASQQAVRQTFEMLVQADAKVRLRCPLVPGVNDTDAHLKAIAELSKAHPELDGVDLLPWHTMGKAKYNYLGRAISTDLPVDNTSDERKAHYLSIMDNHGAVGVVIA